MSASPSANSFVGDPRRMAPDDARVDLLLKVQPRNPADTATLKSAAVTSFG